MHVAAGSETDRGTGLQAQAVSDKRTVARGGLFTLVGSAYAGVFGFLLTLVVGRLFGAHTAGIFFESVSIFMILNGIAILGSDTGMLRSLSSARAVHAHDDGTQIFRSTAGPVLAWSAVVALGLWLGSDWIAQRMLPEDPGHAAAFLHVLSVTLLLSALGQACLNGTRAFGRLQPFVVLYQLWLPTSRVAFVVLLSSMGGDGAWLMWAWAVPLILMDVAAIAYVVLHLRRDRATCDSPRVATDRRQVFRDYWSFNVPRGFASFFETCIVWADVLIVGYLMGPAMAGAYAAASRFITTGTMAMEAMRIGTTPMMAAAFARNEPQRVAEVYKLSSVWLVLLSWPLFLTLAAFSPFVMGLLGDDFLVASDAMTLMSLGILGYLLLGNINAVLLMAGLSKITASNTFVSLCANIALNFLLIPEFGLLGAAIAWSATLILDSTLCVVRGRRRTGVSIPWDGLAWAAVATLGSFGVVGLVVRIVGAQTPLWLAAHLAIAGGMYFLWLRLLRRPLHLDGVLTMVASR